MCPLCKVTEEASSRKKVYQCRYCERWFCKKHLKPEVSVFSPTQVTIKDSAWKNFIEKEWKNKDGHPDYVYTREKMKELEAKEDISKTRRRVGSSPTETSVNCPQCGSKRLMTTASGIQYDALECSDCKFKWKRFHEAFADKAKQKRRIPLKKIATLLAFIAIIIVIVFNGPIYSAFQNFMQPSPYTKVTAVRFQVAEVEFDDNKYQFVYGSTYIMVITPLSEFRFYDVVEGVVYSFPGIEIVVSEVHSDYIVLLVKPNY